MARIHQLASSGNVGLNSASLAMELDTAMRQATGGARSTIFVAEPDLTLRPLNGGDDVDRMAQEIEIPDSDRTPGAAVVPLRGVQQVLGYCVVVGVPRWTPELEERARDVADEFAVRLDTAVLFDEVRSLATAEERNRIAREMHDGVAQEIVGLGYIVDEIESISDQEQTRELASALRSEITRLVSEIRFSIFDLRHEVSDGRLSSSLADYAREVGHSTGLRVHLSLAESGPPLPSRTATEVLRVAQEAIGNVRKHSRADNMWVVLDSDGSRLVPRGPRRRGRQRRAARAPLGAPDDARARQDRRRRPRHHHPTRRRNRRQPAVTRRLHPTKERLPMGTTVLLVDDHELIRQGLARAFERDDEMTVVGQAGSLKEGVAAWETLQPDVVVTDLQLPDGHGLDVVRAIRATNDTTGVVVLTMHAGDDHIFAAMEAGASAFVGKDTRASEVVSAAKHAAVAPRTFLCAGLSQAVMRRATSPAPPKLSGREAEVLTLLADGLGTGEIASSLYMSESTAKTHITHIYQKLGAANRAQALVTAMRMGLLEHAAPQRF